MRSAGNGAVLRQIQTLFSVGTSAGLTDRELLQRFVQRVGEPAGEAAFQTLVERHGPMVLSACRQILGDPHTADDAFQAVFLVLARKAQWLRVEGSLGGWLHGVAHRVAAKARAGHHQRTRREHGDLDANDGIASAWEPPEAAAERAELRRIVHDELGRLPEKYLSPVVLCYLEGLTHDEAAARLSWPVGTVRGRMARARDLLRRRLTRRGVTLPAGGIAAALGRDASAALLPYNLVHSTTQAALAGLGTVGGASTVVGLASTAVVTLADGATKSMLLTKIKFAAAGLVALGTTAGGAGLYLQESAERGSGAVASVPGVAAGADHPQAEPSAKLVALSQKAESEGDLAAAEQYAREACESDPADLAAAGQFLRIRRLRLQLINQASRTLSERDRRSLELVARLNRAITLEHHGTLEGFLLELETLCGVEFLVDPRALSELGRTTNSPVHATFKEVTAATALSTVLMSLGLTYKIADGNILVILASEDNRATPDEAATTATRSQDAQIRLRRLGVERDQIERKLKELIWLDGKAKSPEVEQGGDVPGTSVQDLLERYYGYRERLEQLDTEIMNAEASLRQQIQSSGQPLDDHFERLSEELLEQQAAVVFDASTQVVELDRRIEQANQQFESARRLVSIDNDPAVEKYRRRYESLQRERDELWTRRKPELIRWIREDRALDLLIGDLLSPAFERTEPNLLDQIGLIEKILTTTDDPELRNRIRSMILAPRSGVMERRIAERRRSLQVERKRLETEEANFHQALERLGALRRVGEEPRKDSTSVDDPSAPSEPVDDTES